MGVSGSRERGGLELISTALSAALHVLVAALSLVLVLNDRSPVTVAATAVFVLTYAAGIVPRAAIPGPGPRGWWWVAALTVEWLLLLCLSVEGTYVVFALFFCFMRVLGARWGTAAVAASTAVAVVAFGVHRSFELSGLVGPVLGAGVAVVFGLGYQALTREVGQRQALIEELTRTQTQLGVAERAAGVAQERERLGREIHDTISQSLSSIIMLLHAAQRSGGASMGSGQERLDQARAAAADALAETREFIQALSPPALRTSGIEEALKRLGSRTQETTGLHVHVTVPDVRSTFPTPVETALLRIAQSALANVGQHAHASRVDVTLTRLDDEVFLDVVDDGDGFDPRQLDAEAGGGQPSFGLAAMRERVSDLGGSLVVESEPGHGTSVVASFTLNGASR